MIDTKGIMGGAKKGPLPSQRRERKLSDYVDLYCDKKTACDRKCSLRSTDELTKVKKEDVVFAETRHCQRFRPNGGTVIGADIREVGIWK